MSGPMGGLLMAQLAIEREWGMPPGGMADVDTTTRALMFEDYRRRHEVKSKA